MKAIKEILQRGKPLNQAKKALILLHGRGGNAQELLRLGMEICDSDCCLIAPEATNNVWYPQSFMEDEALNEPYLSLTVKEIKELIDQTAQYIPKSQIFIAGFSQGACLSLEVSSRYATQYGGIIAFTGGLIGKTINESKYHGNFEGIKVYMSNGDFDPYIPLTRTEESKVLMESMGAKVTLQVFKGRPHTVSKAEIDFVKKMFFTRA